MRIASRKNRRYRDIRHLVTFQYLPNKTLACIRTRQFFVHVKVQNSTARVFALQIILQIQSLKRIIGKANGNLRGVGVINILSISRLNNTGEMLFIFLGETIGRPLGGGGLKIVEVASFLLILLNTRTHKIKNLNGHLNTRFFSDVDFIIGVVPNHLVHAVHADSTEVIAKKWQVARGVRVKSAIIHFLHKNTLLLKSGMSKIHQPFQFLLQSREISLEAVAKSRHIESNNAYGTCHLCGTEQPIATLQQFAQIKLQPATHRSHCTGRISVGIMNFFTLFISLPLTADEILKVRAANLSCVLEYFLSNLTIPVKAFSNIHSRDGESERLSGRISLRHHLIISKVNHFHFMSKMAISHLRQHADSHVATLSFNKQFRIFHVLEKRKIILRWNLLLQVVRRNDVKRDICKWRLPPTSWHIQVINELLDRFFDFFKRQSVIKNIRCQISVKAAERLRPRPL